MFPICLQFSPLITYFFDEINIRIGTMCLLSQYRILSAIQYLPSWNHVEGLLGCDYVLSFINIGGPFLEKFMIPIRWIIFVMIKLGEILLFIISIRTNLFGIKD